MEPVKSHLLVLLDELELGGEVDVGSGSVSVGLPGSPAVSVSPLPTEYLCPSSK